MAMKVLGNVFTNEKEGSKEKVSKEALQPLTEKELNFVLAKLREANYKGHEFEMFYNVYVKLINQKPK